MAGATILPVPITTVLNTEGNALLTVTSAASQGVVGTIVQVVAATAHTVIGIAIHYIGTAGSAGGKDRILVYTGAGGAEVLRYTIYTGNNVANETGDIYIPNSPTLFPRGTRVSLGVINDSGAGAISWVISTTLCEIND